MVGAAPVQQPPELKSGEAGTAEMPPLVYGPPGACRRRYRRRRGTGQKAQAGHPGGRPCPPLCYRTGSTTDASPLPPGLQSTGGLLGGAESQISCSSRAPGGSDRRAGFPAESDGWGRR